MNPRNVLITGPSRSGTTLTCELLNLVPDVVALDEPLNAEMILGYALPEPGPPRPSGEHRSPRALARRLLNRLGNGQRRPLDEQRMCDNIEQFLSATRESIIRRRVALSRHVGGRVIGKKVADEVGESGSRVRLAERGEIAIEKAVTDGFVLAVKQTSGFIAMLGTIVQRFRVFAVIRNPLSIISSWQSIPFHPNDGHVKLGEGIDRQLARTLARIPDRIDRQFRLLEWYFARIRDHVPAAQVIRYEELVASGGAVLATVTDAAAALSVPLENRNHHPARERFIAQALGVRLLETEGAWWHFYPRESVQELLTR